MIQPVTCKETDCKGDFLFTGIEIMCIYKYGSLVSTEDYFFFSNVEVVHFHQGDCCIHLPTLR